MTVFLNPSELRLQGTWRTKENQVPAERPMSPCLPGPGTLGTGEDLAGIVEEIDGC